MQYNLEVAYEGTAVLTSLLPSTAVSRSKGIAMNVVVTITYNAVKHGILDPFFACVAAQRDRDFVLLVIDNASSDGTADYLRALNMPNVRILLNNKNVGFGRACNQGIEIARKLGAEHITFLNNDTQFDSGLFGGMVATLRETGADALSPLITYYDKPDHVWYVTSSFRWSRGMIPLHDHFRRHRSEIPSNRLQWTEFATGCCLILPMYVFDVLSGFDDRYFVYWEDTDLCMDLKRHGMKLVVDTQLVLQHKVSISTGGQFSDFTIFQFTRGHMMFARKYFGTTKTLAMLPILFAKAMANVVLGRMKPQQFGTWFKGISSGLRS